MAGATRRWAQERPDDLALRDERTSWTWVEVDERLNRVANGVQVIDDGKDACVAIFSENCAEAVLMYLGSVVGSVTTVPISFHLTAGEVAHILRDSGARALFVGPETLAVGRSAAAEAGVDVVVAWRSGSETVGDVDVTDFTTWLDNASDVEPDPHGPLRQHLHYTSGTTGQPKGTATPPAMLPGGPTIADHVEAIQTHPSFTPGGVSLVVGPLYHTGPLSALRSLWAGVAQVVLTRFDPEATLAAIDRYRVTNSIMVPTHFQRLLTLPEATRAKYDVSSLVIVGHTGSACPVEVKRQMIDWWGPVLFEAYGGTESGATNAITSLEWLEHPGSVGRTLPPFEPVVVDDDGQELAPGTAGRLFFRDTTGRGIEYHNDPDKTAAAHLAPGVFTLGDIGFVDDDGYVYITDRSVDMVLSGGVNIYPAEAEVVLHRHPQIADVACIGIPDPDLGEQLLALIVPVDAGDPPDPAELVAFCRREIAHYKAPRVIEMRDDLGRNDMGKLDKKALRAPYWPTGRTIGG